MAMPLTISAPLPARIRVPPIRIAEAVMIALFTAFMALPVFPAGGEFQCRSAG